MEIRLRIDKKYVHKVRRVKSVLDENLSTSVTLPAKLKRLTKKRETMPSRPSNSSSAYVDPLTSVASHWRGIVHPADPLSQGQTPPPLEDTLELALE